MNRPYEEDIVKVIQDPKMEREDALPIIEQLPNTVYVWEYE